MRGRKSAIFEHFCCFPLIAAYQAGKYQPECTKSVSDDAKGGRPRYFTQWGIYLATMGERIEDAVRLGGGRYVQGYVETLFSCSPPAAKHCPGSGCPELKLRKSDQIRIGWLGAGRRGTAMVSKRVHDFDLAVQDFRVIMKGLAALAI